MATLADNQRMKTPAGEAVSELSQRRAETRGGRMKRLQMLVLGALAALSANAAMAQESGSFGWQESVAGKPVPGGIHWQRAASPVMEDIAWLETFMNYILLGVMALVCGLILVVVLRFNRRMNPTPATFSHNALIEVIWTVLPVITLIIIAIPSLKLLFFQLEVPDPDVTIKATGSQWFWTYEYPEEEIEFASIMLERDELEEYGYQQDEYLLATDTRVVVPVNKVVHVLTTATDVIHAWTIPSFGSKIDAMPGRLNETWFKATETGTFFGQCSELCGIRHSYMPIVVEVVEQEEYDAWISEQQAARQPGNADTRLAAGN